MQDREGHKWQGCKEDTAHILQLVENSRRLVGEELEPQRMERIQDRAYSERQMLIVLVRPGLPWHAGYPRSDVMLHRRMLLRVVRYRHSY